MILYADTSALVKKYVREPGSDQVLDFFADFESIGTTALTQVEMAAAMAKAVRLGWVPEAEMSAGWKAFLSHWLAYTRIPVTSKLVERASLLAWKHGLRAYDSVHLASALIWQEAMAETAIFACYDNRLLDTAVKEGLQIWPQIR